MVWGSARFYDERNTYRDVELGAGYKGSGGNFRSPNPSAPHVPIRPPGRVGPPPWVYPRKGRRPRWMWPKPLLRPSFEWLRNLWSPGSQFGDVLFWAETSPSIPQYTNFEYRRSCPEPQLACGSRQGMFVGRVTLDPGGCGDCTLPCVTQVTTFEEAALDAPAVGHWVHQMWNSSISTGASRYAYERTGPGVPLPVQYVLPAVGDPIEEPLPVYELAPQPQLDDSSLEGADPIGVTVSQPGTTSYVHFLPGRGGQGEVWYPDPDYRPPITPKPPTAPVPGAVIGPGRPGPGPGGTPEPYPDPKLERPGGSEVALDIDVKPRRRARPPRRRDRKVSGPAWAMVKLYHGLTEVGDAADAVYEALSPQAKRECGRPAGSTGKAACVATHLGDVDILQAVKNIIKNELEDRAVGTAMGFWQKKALAARKAGYRPPSTTQATQVGRTLQGMMTDLGGI